MNVQRFQLQIDDLYIDTVYSDVYDISTCIQFQNNSLMINRRSSAAAGTVVKVTSRTHVDFVIRTLWYAADRETYYQLWRRSCIASRFLIVTHLLEEVLWTFHEFYPMEYSCLLYYVFIYTHNYVWFTCSPTYVNT